MLQNTAQPHPSLAYDAPEAGFDWARYLQALKRRALWILIPFALFLGAGTTVVMLLPSKFLSEGKILIESQQIPTDLVRPTVTATAKERIHVIEQRVLTRDNLLGIANKFQLFADKRNKMSGTDIYDVMRERVKVQPVELNPNRRSNEALTIALTVGYEDERPEIARQVANELMTLFLAEDARNRTTRASETTRFLAREVKKLEGDLVAVEAQLGEYRKANTQPVPERVLLQLGALKAELQEKSSILSNSHPDLIRIKRQIAALEQITARAPQDDAGLEALQNQRAAIQKSLEGASEKLSRARLGESLERDQFSERLEVLEQAILPQKPIKPNRPKLLIMVLALALAAGGGLALGLEMLDGSIRGTRDLLRVADGHMMVAIPYITTNSELRRSRLRIIGATVFVVVFAAAGLIGAHLLLRPLDELWAILLARLVV